MSSTIAACLTPPAITELDASEGLPPWILLDTRVYFARRKGPTMASGKTSKGQDIEVSICFANPPALSYVCIYCPDLKDDNFAEEPRVVRSEKQFLLLHLPLNWSTRFVRRSSEYLMYEAIPGKPKLTGIPRPDNRLLLPGDLGIYCCNDGGYLLAGLCPTRNLEGYELNLYSSASESWTSKPACMDKPPIDKYHPSLAHKVILLGGSLLAWVDLWKGMLVCDVLYDDPTVDPLDDPLDHPVPVWFIPLPELLPGNQDEHVCPWMVRDITCTNGALKLIEIELLISQNVVKERTVTSDDLCFVRPDDEIAPRKLVGWRSVIWNRVLSDKGWCKGCEVRAEDILVVNPSHSALLAGLNNNIVGHSTLMKVLPSFPTLSIHGDNVVHMNCSLRCNVAKARMISIDMGNKALQTLEPCPPGELGDYCPHFPCVLSNHLSNTPALPQAVQVSNPENVTEDQGLRSCAQEVTSVPNRAQNGGSHFALSSVPRQSFGLLDAVTSYNRSPYEYADYTHPSYGNHLSNTPALPQAVQVNNPENVTEEQGLRSCAQEVTSVPNRAQNGGSHFDLSLVPRQSFGLLDAVTSYNRSPYEYADYTHPCYGNHQQPLALQQQPAHLPNWLDFTSWFSSRSVNAHPAYQVFNTAALGQMVHPSQAVQLNSCHLFRPPSQAGVLPTPSPLPSIPHRVAGHPSRGPRHRRQHRLSPYDRSHQMTSHGNEFLH